MMSNQQLHNMETEGTVEIISFKLLISQMEKLRPRERRALAQGQLVPQCQSLVC